MANNAVQSGATPASQGSLSLVSRFIGILTSPKETFQAVVAQPKWLGMLVVVSFIIAAGASLPLTTEGGQQSQLDQQVRFMESFGAQISDAQYDAMRQSLRFAALQGFIWTLVFGPISGLILAGILFGVFAVMGGQATFKQVFAVCVHAAVIFAASLLFVGPLNYFRESVSSATNLGVLNLANEDSYVGKLLGLIDLFWIWWIIVISIGLAVLYRRKTQSIALGFFAIYAVVIVLVAALMSMFGRS
jgi:hypothetical protein